MQKNKLLGYWGENLAEKYLLKNKYIILEKNWRYQHKEIDIIAFKEKIIALEIKTRLKQCSEAQTILKASQLENIRLALKEYCEKNNYDYEKSRLDLIIIIKKDRLANLKHFLNL